MATVLSPSAAGSGEEELSSGGREEEGLPCTG